MLRELFIKNFAIIDDLRIRFSEGLTILSGETGAGKSIIINAVNLLLGSRASANLIRTGAETAELEAFFHILPASSAAVAMLGQGLDIEEGLLIRRIISRNDRHRIYINGRLATMQALKAITRHMASISGQHAHQGLLKEDRQLLILDQFGGLMPHRHKVYDAYHRLIPLLNELKTLTRMKKKQADQIDLLDFQLKEIQAARIHPGEDAELEQEASRLKHAEKLYQSVYECLGTLYSANGAVVEQLAGVKKELENVSRLDPLLSAPADSVAEITFRIEDIVQELRTYLPRIQTDEKRLSEIEDRQDLLNTLKRKYGNTLEMVLHEADVIQQELAAVENLSEKIKATETALKKAHAQTAQLCRQLSKERDKAAKAIAQKVEKELATLKMPNTKFRIRLTVTEAGKDLDEHLQAGRHVISETGLERAAYMMAPNVGEALKPLSDIASGGELSRVVLALKAILAHNDAVETVVFDEVDAGIGGGAAEVVGKKLADLSGVHQVICITHLPQIAKFGNAHFLISKKVRDGRTKTVIDRLDAQDRVQEVARMLGGEKITPKTLDHAREMLEEISS
ncbi:MAG: DNA repair protein RecN [Deltaproteobacteria bacterium]|nr:DNA repair protein RecN [Deltaproteobacteria bacterium]